MGAGALSRPIMMSRAGLSVRIAVQFRNLWADRPSGFGRRPLRGSFASLCKVTASTAIDSRCPRIRPRPSRRRSASRSRTVPSLGTEPPGTAADSPLAASGSMSFHRPAGAVLALVSSGLMSLDRWDRDSLSVFGLVLPSDGRHELDCEMNCGGPSGHSKCASRSPGALSRRCRGVPVGRGARRC